MTSVSYGVSAKSRAGDDFGDDLFDHGWIIIDGEKELPSWFVISVRDLAVTAKMENELPAEYTLETAGDES